jgi:hypothetical protein
MRQIYANDSARHCAHGAVVRWDICSCGAIRKTDISYIRYRATAAAFCKTKYRSTFRSHPVHCAFMHEVGAPLSGLDLHFVRRLR